MPGQAGLGPETKNPVLAAIFSRRSIREYQDEPVSKKDLEMILEAGRFAPSGLNNQPWRFLALLPEDKRVQGLAGCTKYASIVRTARTLVVVFLEKRAMYHPMKDHQSAGACIQNMLLAAHALGLGAVWLGEIVGREAKVLDVLGLDPDAYQLMAVVALGRPARQGASSRRPLGELLLEEI